ncbi:MAG: serine/threonine protein kinase [Acidobacteria bacterium]|nr:serine/threonine protein kinase [Acidobacteriota bacterium]
MNFSDLIGQTLDEKYQIERELGRGGMGTVYLATHLGTERPVAIKVIAPQFMERAEFVERFRREARAAGRLRHPNVVDVTDFGFADTDEGQVAYLVMEYLDGCTLGEILEEEKNLPVSWTLDILEQVCSAVQEAHEEGIIHRDLKPDNIWLEPNQRGGYTVKVLDFGIAKLEAQERHDLNDHAVREGSPQTLIAGAGSTFAGSPHDGTIHDSITPTLVGDGSATAVIGPVAGSENETILQGAGGREDKGGTPAANAGAGGRVDQEDAKTRLMDTAGSGNGIDTATSHSSLISAPTASNLTRVGSVLGTPLYMSPEQCRGDRLDPRSDIYSLGIIAYQMLSGDTPFRGDFTRVMESHKYLPPPNFSAKGVRKKLKRVILDSLSKNPDDRPQTAEAFASALRARSEGIFGLLRRAGMIWTEHIQKFTTLSMFFFLPIIGTTVLAVVLGFLKASEAIPSFAADIGLGVTGIVNFLMTAFCAFLIIGTISWIVTQSLAMPLRPIRLRAALSDARKKWKTFAGLGILTTLAPILAAAVAAAIAFAVIFGVLWLLFGVGTVTVLIAAIVSVSAAIVAFFLAAVKLMLIAPVVMMEGLRGWKAVKRSNALISRSMATALAAYVIMFMIPMVTAGTLSIMVNISAKAFNGKSLYSENGRSQDPASGAAQASEINGRDTAIEIDLGRGTRFEQKEPPKDMRARLVDAVLETLLQIFLLPIQIITISFTAIIIALLYLKTRQAGGEPLEDLLARFEETDKPRKKWQERVRQRLIQSGRITGRS